MCAFLVFASLARNCPLGGVLKFGVVRCVQLFCYVRLVAAAASAGFPGGRIQGLRWFRVCDQWASEEKSK